MRALYTASTGMMAQELNVQVISNNIANMRTTGYKRQQAHFQDLLYQNMRRAGSITSDQNTQVPAAIGRFRREDRQHRAGDDRRQRHVDREGIRHCRAGRRLLPIRLPDGRTAYTRDGSFDLDAQGQLVTRDGYLVDPGITVPQNARSVQIGPTGTVQATIPGQTQPQALGQLQLARFINRTGLESMGDNLFLETPSSGPAIDGTPGDEGFGKLQQGYLEEANVNAVTEISSLISAQRAYEMNARIITAADQMLSSTTQMFRG